MMALTRSLLLVSVLLALGVGTTVAQPDWENPAVVQRNRLPAHATLMPYDQVASVLADDRSASPYYKLLSGQWAFQWAHHPDEAPADFFNPSYEVTDWDRIRVPAMWQTEGYGTALYTNYEWALRVRPTARRLSDARQRDGKLPADVYRPVGLGGAPRRGSLRRCEEQVFSALQESVSALEPGKETTITFRRAVSNPEKWTAETPNLYTAVVNLMDGQGRVLEREGDRMRRVVERDKNHPSVIMWSLGNENKVGPNLNSMSVWVRERDPNRVVYYDHIDDPSHPHTDIRISTYESPSSLRAKANDRMPVIMKEFAHCPSTRCRRSPRSTSSCFVL